LIPADGFYEWARRANGKQPYCFEVNNGELFAFAGLWDGWRDSNGQWVKTCSILTTTPNAVTSAVHDRMPVILDPDSYDIWLDPGKQNVVAISELLKPYDARSMRSYPVSPRKEYPLSAPTVVRDPTRRRFRIPVRVVLRMVGADEYMELAAH
jgi:putative SOS response-associated peptidase YedK